MAEEFDRSHTTLENLHNLLIEEDLLDFTVQVEDVEIRCHRVILAGSSHFFRGLLRSDMKEANIGCVSLNGMSPLTFQHILITMYSGKVILTLDNYIDIWKAVDQLQIDFMIKDCETFALKVMSEENFMTTWKLAEQLQKNAIVERCEEFALKTLSVKNFESISKTAEEVNSKNVVNACKSFMLNNFDDVSHTATVMALPFEDFLSLIESQDLKVSSEDLVLERVIQWVMYVPQNYEQGAIYRKSLNNDFQVDKNIDENSVEIFDKDEDGNSDVVSDCVKQSIEEINNESEDGSKIQLLTKLLNSVRTSIVSTPTLEYFLKHQLILDNPKARDILSDAVLYKTTHYNHGQWRTSAIHRASSEWEHCGMVFVENGNFNIITASDEKLYTCLANDELLLDVTFVVFDSYLYATGVQHTYETNSRLCVFSGNSWNKLAKIPGRQLILVPYDQSIIVLSKTATKLYRIFPKCWNPTVEEFKKLPDTIKIQQAINYQRTILIFSFVTVNGEEKTAVHQLDILTKKLTELEQLNGPAEQIISFNDDNNTYVLQTVGDLWIINCLVEKVTFKLLGRLWTIKRKLYGALTYKKKLTTFGCNPTHEPAEQKRLSSFKEYFNCIEYWGTDETCSNFIPITLQKDELVPD